MHLASPQFARDDVEVRLDGWNYIPEGYGMQWDLGRAPMWLRLWFKMPIVDRFAYPIVVRRGYAWLVPDGGTNERPLPAPAGWRVGEPRVVVTELQQR